MAKAQLTQEAPEINFYSTVTGDVYVGLTDDEALRLALRHNQNSHFTHRITHRDLVSLSVYIQWNLSIVVTV